MGRGGAGMMRVKRRLGESLGEGFVSCLLLREGRWEYGRLIDIFKG